MIKCFYWITKVPGEKIRGESTMNHIISDDDMTEMHDLIVEINRNAFKLERDVRNLNNLIHVVKGDGIRFVEFRKD